MFISDHHLFVHKGRQYIIDVEKMKTSVIDKETASALNQVVSCLNDNNRLTPESKKKLEKLGLIHKSKPKSEHKPSELVPVINISLFVTQECNFNCVYCYGDGGCYGSSGDMSSETARKAVDWLISQAGESQKLHISFFGGEPLLNFPLIKEVVEYATEQGKETGKEFRYGITSNLSLLDDEKLSFLIENKIKIVVSFDGPKDIQDKQRPFKNRNGSTYEDVLPKIRKFLAVDPKSTCRATLMENSEAVVVRKSLWDIGFSEVRIASASSSLCDSNSKKTEHSTECSMIRMAESDAELLLKNIKERNTDQVIKYKLTGCMFEFLVAFNNDQKKLFRCGAGRETVGVSNKGDVFLCHRFVGAEGYKLGSVSLEKLKRDPYLKKTVNTIDECSRCYAKYFCGGGCYYNNLGSTGSVFKPSESYCRIIKRTVELAAYVSSNLDKEDLKYLINEKLIGEAPSVKIAKIGRKQQVLLKKLKNLGLPEEDIKKLTNGFSFEEYEKKIKRNYTQGD